MGRELLSWGEGMQVMGGVEAMSGRGVNVVYCPWALILPVVQAEGTGGRGEDRLNFSSWSGLLGCGS